MNRGRPIYFIRCSLIKNKGQPYNVIPYRRLPNELAG